MNQAIVDIPVYSIHDLRMRQVTLNLEGTARLLVCVLIEKHEEEQTRQFI